jgi:protoporphyrinogen oxidase
VSGEYRFDIGGHRFFTKNREIDSLVRDLLGDELIEVNRRSKIYMRRRFFNYPLKPANALLGLGPFTIFRILVDYGWQRVIGLIDRNPGVSLEDWVVRNFGRTMFNIYFREYSEKVWGLQCSFISRKWVAKRIQGLSLGKAIQNAFFKFTGKDVPTLVDSFIYPRLGIGRISDRFHEEITKTDSLFTDTRVMRVCHEGFEVTGVEVMNCDKTYFIEGGDYVSTIPLNTLVRMMDPSPPPHVTEAASGLGYRDLVLVAVEVDREFVTDQTWIYIPEKNIPFGRLHEPKTWSPHMAPEDKTLVVIEYFCFRGDSIWDSTDRELSDITVSGLRDLGFVKSKEVLGTSVLRIPRAYPLFEVGYEERCDTIYDYLGKFSNLFIAGRAGMFQYQNMDHAMESGMRAADEVISKTRIA